MEVKLYARRNTGKSQNRRHFGRILSLELKDMTQTLSSTVKRMDSDPHSSFTRFLNNLDGKTTLVPSIQQCKHFALFTYLQNTLFKVYCNITPLRIFSLVFLLVYKRNESELHSKNGHFILNSTAETELITQTTLFQSSNVVSLQTRLDIFNGNITERMKLLWEDRKQH